MIEQRHACRVCTRTDLTTKADGTVRVHAANGKRPGPGNQPCPGGSSLPREPERQVTSSGGPNPYRAPLPDHVHRFMYGDDDIGNSGSFCTVCGQEEEPVEPGLPHDRQTDENQTEEPWTTQSSKLSTTDGADPASKPSEKEISSSPTALATSTRSASMTEAQVTDVFESAVPPRVRTDQRVERDGWGRYKLIHPQTGGKQAWQRATTFAKMLQDTFGLAAWQQRMVAKGLSLRPDLLDMVSTLDVKRDREQLNKLLEEAKDVAGQKVKANQGTVVHKHTEEVDLGGSLDDVPARYREDVAAYRNEIKRAGLEIVPNLIERITAVTDIDVAGTLDRVVRDRHGKYRVLDVKTGNMDFGQLEICIQLALYTHGVNTSGVYDLDSGTWLSPGSYGDSVETGPWDIPRVETDYALVAHIPVGSGTCELLRVPIDTGWEAVQTAAQVRDWRKQKKLFTPYDPDEPAEEGDPATTYSGLLAAAVGDPGTVTVRPPTWDQRFGAVSSRGEAASLYREALAAIGDGKELRRLVSIAKDKLSG